MLSERQIHHLLEDCEAKLKHPLAMLRERLLHDRNHDSAIWELVLLYVALKRFARLEPEIGPALPDIVVKAPWLHRCSLEAAVVTSPSATAIDHCSEFHTWLYGEIKALGISLNGASISTEVVPGKEQHAQVPPKHRWRPMQRHPSWQRFVDQLRCACQAFWECPEGGITVHFRVQDNGILSGQPFVPKGPTDIQKHPVYREIRRKARQARSWPTHLKKRPVVLAICAPGSGSEFWKHGNNYDYSVKRAIFAALLDHDRMADLDRLNILRQHLKLSPDGPYVDSKRLRVAGSDAISAVLFVRIEQVHGRGILVPKSKASPDIYFNPHARSPLPKSLATEIKQLDFNAIEYGPGWESWHDTARDSLKMRNLRRGGPFEMRSGEKGEIELRVPTTKILKILAGEGTAQAVFSDYGDKPPNPLHIFEKALASELTLQSVEVIDPDPTTRAEQQIAFRFGEGKGAVVARAKERG